MKALVIALLFVVSQASGQDTTDPYEGKEVDATWVVEPMMPATPYQRPITWPEYLSLWDEWKDSCWADSTICISFPSPTPGVKDIKCYKDAPEWCRDCGFWRHRNPNDLEGWMEFLKRRTR